MKLGTKYLLETKLEDLHHQSSLWIKDVEFHLFELKFYRELISDKINMTTTEDLCHKNIYGNIDLLLYRLSEELLDELKSHKRRLYTVIQESDTTNNREYRMRHIVLYNKMKALEKSLTGLKRSLYNYIQKHPFEFDFDTMFKDIN